MPAAGKCSSESRSVGGHDNDHRTIRESTLNLRDLVRAEEAARTIHSHDAGQWRTPGAVYRGTTGKRR